MIRTPQRDDLAMFLQEAGISSSVHYKPLHLYPAYAGVQRLPVAERVWKQILTFLLFPGLTDDQQNLICDTVQGYFDRRPREAQ